MSASESDIIFNCENAVSRFGSAALLNVSGQFAVIIDSEIFQFLPKCAEAGGLVVALRPNRVCAESIYFGREYCKETLTGLAVSAGRSLASRLRKIALFSIAALSLILSAIDSDAGIGWTLAQAKQQYGKPVLNQVLIAGQRAYVFTLEDYVVAAFFLKAQVSRILYICRNGSVFDWARARALLRANAPDAIWSDASKEEAENCYRIIGVMNGDEAYYASLTDDGTMLAIWTKQDEEGGRIMRKANVPALSSTGNSNDKSSAEINAVLATDIDAGLRPETNSPDLQTNANSGSSSQRHHRAPTAPTKNRSVTRRSSMQPRYANVKARLIALWHESLKHQKSRTKTPSSKSLPSH